MPEGGIRGEWLDRNFLDGVLGWAESQRSKQSFIGGAIEQHFADLVGRTANRPGVAGIVVEGMNLLWGRRSDDACRKFRERGRRAAV